MNMLWVLIAAAVIVLLALSYLRARQVGSGLFYWPWMSSTRGDRALQTYVAEEEIKRTASPKDRDLAP